VQEAGKPRELYRSSLKIDMKWCCQTFKGWYDEAGKRGLGLLLGRSSTNNDPYFLIQHRVVDSGLEKSVVSANPASVVSEIGIQFCPWCGQNLRAVYKKVVDELARPDLEISPKSLVVILPPAPASCHLSQGPLSGK
jgi:hypothetical protein